jgi:RNA polymerase sigma-70 factor, ECF subfamily
MTLDQEKALLENIRTEPQQFGVFFDRYYKIIFSYVFKRTGNYDLSKDITAETFLKAFLKIRSFEWKGVSIAAWFYTIATNEVNYYFRKQKYYARTMERVLNSAQIDFLNLSSQWQAEKTALEKELDDLENFKLIQEKLKLLDLKYQEVIALRYFENKDNQEISQILHKPEGTVKSLISRGLEKLRKLATE